MTNSNKVVFTIDEPRERLIDSFAERAAMAGMTPNELIKRFVIDVSMGDLGDDFRTETTDYIDQCLKAYALENEDNKDLSFTAYLAKNGKLSKVATEVENLYFEKPITEESEVESILEESELMEKVENSEDGIIDPLTFKRIDLTTSLAYRGLQAIHSDYLIAQGDKPSLSFIEAIKSVARYKLNRNRLVER